MNDTAATPQRFHSLDVLRGVAALAVVFWHWQHFFYNGLVPGAMDMERLPLYGVFAPLYRHGWQAVDLFFALSGFVFYWLYSEKVARGKVAARNFAVLRLSRLYPLHLVTLLLVAAGQYWYVSRLGAYYVYPFNDPFHFLLNLAFAPSWSFEHGWSFNAPVWSVSVEILLYMMFFLLCRRLPVRAPLLLLLSAAGFTLIASWYEPIGRGVGSFFLGGCMVLAWRAVLASRRRDAWRRGIGFAGAAAWLGTLALAQAGMHDVVLPAWLAGSVDAVSHHWGPVVLFPLTILWLALAESRHAGLGRHWAWLGDLSYSSYLLHFPLQMLVMALVMLLPVTRAIFYSPIVFLLFFAVLIALSLASHRWFEVPVQRALRTRLLK